MPLPKENRKCTFENFLEIDKGEELLEYIYGEIYYQASPSTEHQRIVTNLSTEFGIFFKNKECKHFVSPYDIFLKNDIANEKNKVQPDLMVICDKQGFNENNYVGVPVLVVEVLSPSTTSKDYIIKMDLYMRYGVKEYWIVSPKNKSIQMFVLQDSTYGEPINYSKDDLLKSTVFKDLKINLKDIF